MENTLLSVLSLWLFCRHTLCSDYVTYGPKQYCQMESFNGSCPRDDQVIVMQSAEYGRMGPSRCTEGYGVTGCKSDVLWYLDSRCSGRPKCTIRIPDDVLHKNNPCPKDYTSYLELSYSCKQVVTRRQCDSEGYMDTGEGSGTLASSVTDTTVGTVSCPWRVKGLPNQHVNLTLFNFARAVEGEDAKAPGSHGTRTCYHVGKVRDGTDTVNIHSCAGDPRQKIVYTSRSHSVDIHFLTGKAEAFLLGFKVYGCPSLGKQKNARVLRDGNTVIITCENSQESYILTCRDNVWTGERGNCSAAEKSWAFNNFFGSFPYGILIVVAIGVALGVFFGGLLLTCVHAYMKRQRAAEECGPHSDPLYMERRGFPKYIEDDKHYSSPSMKPYPELSEVSTPGRDRHMPSGTSSALVDRYMQEENVKNETDLHQSHSTAGLKHIYESPQFL